MKKIQNKNEWLDGEMNFSVKNIEDLAIEIGANVAQARINKGYTQEKLAKKVGTLQPGIARIERGTHVPSFQFLLRIAKALNTFVVPPTFQSILKVSINEERKDNLVNLTSASHTHEIKRSFSTMSSYFVATTSVAAPFIRTS